MKKYLSLLVLFAIVEIGLALYLTYWRESWWDAVANKDVSLFFHGLGTFTIAALAICFVSGISGYLINLSVIEWRQKLTDKARYQHTDMLMLIDAGHLYELPENYNQRQQEDCWQFPDLTINLLYGLVKSIFYIVVFTISLLASFKAWYLLVIVSYAVVSTLCTHYIARPLIKLNYENQRAEATYRNSLTIENFNDCIRIMLGIAKKTKRLNYLQSFIGQVGIVLPILLIAPEYFGTAMTIGLLMRFNSVAGTILENLNYGVSSFGQINRLISCRKRLKECSII